ncbi:MAG: carboxylating nicotinate-nucleotide diphosphorylase [Desulfobacteraceae bacterium]|nr:carboxylating nicotinate-nucleotide diphosphorylase [Desulfobacteraceae bacterium]
MKTFDFTLADKLIDLALLEDIGSGDITTQCVIDNEKKGSAVIKAKEPFVLCGTDVAKRVFLRVDPEISIVKSFEDGSKLNKGDVILKAFGSMASLLKAERTALNFLQRLSGISTNTSKYVEKLKNYPDVRLCDTRKTTPGLRVFEKYAVFTGGASNHRTGLYDGVLIKDNHIQAAGSISKAVLSVRKKVSHLVKIEVEVENLNEVKEALEVGADVIMLDNMNNDQIRESCQIINKKALVEVSGNVTLERLEELALTGADIISCGALIHQAVSVDLSMSLEAV